MVNLADRSAIPRSNTEMFSWIADREGFSGEQRQAFVTYPYCNHRALNSRSRGGKIDGHYFLKSGSSWPNT